MREIIDIWKFQQVLARRLLTWSVPSALIGLFLLLLGDSFWQAFGTQAVTWGVIDALIALGGRWQSGRRRAALGVTPDPDRIEKEGAKLKRVLWINTSLDLLYIAAGIVLALILGLSSLESSTTDTDSGSKRWKAPSGACKSGIILFFSWATPWGERWLSRRLPQSPLGRFGNTCDPG
jgi:hypothetical protein